MTTHDWTCPFCNRHATITDSSIHLSATDLTITNSEGSRRLRSFFTVCPNPKCKRYELRLELVGIRWLEKRGFIEDGVLSTWNLIPPSRAQVLPDYVPQPIREDYCEACLIVGHSPKASATLSRRCLQGILRDYWRVKPGRLADEIQQVKDKIDQLTWDAIEAVRTVGNIGAHMEQDINVIVDVEPGEAELLIGLIETVIRDWYIAREDRKSRLTQLAQLAQAKDAARKGGASTT